MESQNGSDSMIDAFQLVQNGKQLLPILRERLPHSANVYNMALMHENFLNEMKIYTLNGDLSDGCWIVIIFEREDYGRDINISAPLQDEETLINETIKSAFLSSKLFDWDQPFFFTALTRPISKMIFDISCHIKGHKTTVNPSVIYYAPAELSLHDHHPTSPKAKSQTFIESLNSTPGVDFIVDNWKYAKEGTRIYVEKIIERNPSVGVLIQDDKIAAESKKIVSGVVTTANGFLGMLYTDPAYRNRKLGSLTMKSLIQKLLEEKFIPCSVVEQHNKVSKKFHEKIGMIYSHPVDFVFNI